MRGHHNKYFNFSLNSWPPLLLDSFSVPEINLIINKIKTTSPPRSRLEPARAMKVQKRNPVTQLKASHEAHLRTTLAERVSEFLVLEPSH